MNVNFYKYQGTGNDFVIIDNRKNNIFLSKEQIATICNRKFGVGADGLMLLKLHNKYDFEMVYYNSDGNESSMCGNGGRCLIAFAHKLGLIDNECTFLAIDGIHLGKIENDLVHLKMGDVTEIEKTENYYYLDTGSPHYIEFVDEVEHINVVEKAREIRCNSRFKEKGINVNFVDKKNEKVRTYERGVEDETLSCGTGVTACAIAMNLENENRYKNKCTLVTKGGKLSVIFNRTPNGSYNDIWLIGLATYVFKGEIDV